MRAERTKPGVLVSSEAGPARGTQVMGLLSVPTGFCFRRKRRGELSEATVSRAFRVTSRGTEPGTQESFLQELSRTLVIREAGGGGGGGTQDGQELSFCREVTAPSLQHQWEGKGETDVEICWDHLGSVHLSGFWAATECLRIEQGIRGKCKRKQKGRRGGRKEGRRGLDSRR